MLFYGLFICLLGAVQVASAHRIVSSYGANLNQISLVTLSLSLPQDIYLAILHFYLMVGMPLYFLYFIPTLLSCVVQVCYSAKLIASVFRCQTQN